MNLSSTIVFSKISTFALSKIQTPKSVRIILRRLLISIKRKIFFAIWLIFRFFFEVDQTFWNEIMTVITTFVVVSRFDVDDEQQQDDNFFSIIKSVENVDYFDFEYENSIDTDQFIVNVKRYNYYRNVYIFIDYFRDLKKIDFDFKVKKLIFICFKSKTLRWYFIELIEIKKNYFRKTFIERWCINLTKRFKKRNFIVLKKLQTKSYTYVDVRRDRKSRFYMQNILRYAKAANYSSIYH